LERNRIRQKREHKWEICKWKPNKTITPSKTNQ
jgi:hypothetical protein